MPKIDSLTGCEVMTLPEFLNDEGQRQGKTGGEVWDDIMSSMNEDTRMMVESHKDVSFIGPEIKRCTDEIYDDWQHAKNHYEKHGPMSYPRWDAETQQFIQYTESPFNDPEPPKVRRILFVDDAKCHQSFRGSSASVEVIALCSDWKCRRLKWHYSSSYATRMEPEDFDEELEWLKVESTLLCLLKWTVATIRRWKQSWRKSK